MSPAVLSDATLSDESLLARLVAFDSTSRHSNLPIADFICDYLDRPGVRLERFPSPAGDKVNLVIAVGPEVDPATRDGLTLSGHMDVVPAEEPGWTSDPFTLTDRGDRWLGRGACDMKGFDALAINLAARAAAERRRLRHPLVLILTYDEEIGTVGAHDLSRAWPRQRPLPRRTVIGEPTSLEVVRLHKGHTKLRLRVEGKAAHSGYPHLGTSAIEPAARAIVALEGLRRALAGEPCPHAEHFPEVPYVALNVGTVRGGSAVNVIPERCEVGIGFRVLPGMAAAPIVERVRDVVGDAVDAARHELELVNDSPPLLLDEGDDLYRHLCQLRGQRGTRSASYATDAGWLQTLGLDCLIFGPGSIEVAHQADEHMPKDEYRRGGEIFAALLARYCGAEPS